MGNACSAFAAEEQDPDDRTLEEVEIEKTKVPSFDSAFSGAADPLNSMVTVNNNLCASVENVKLIAAALLGALEPKVHSERYCVALQKESKELSEEALEGAWAANAALKRAYTSVNSAAKTLEEHKSAEGITLNSDKNDRITVKPAFGSDPNAIKQAKSAAKSYNHALFSLKKLTMQLSADDTMSISKAVREVIERLKAADQHMKPTCEVNESGLQSLASGNDVEPSSIFKFNMNLTKALPEHLQTVYEAVCGDDGLIAAINSTLEEISGFNGKCDNAKAQVEALPRDPEGLKSACDSAGLSPMEMFKAVKVISANTAATATAPTIMKGVSATLAFVMAEVKLGVEAAKHVAAAADATKAVNAVVQAGETQPSSPTVA